MSPGFARLLVRLYPRSWRARYAVEFEALLLAGPGSLRTLVDVAWSALHEHALPTRGPHMNPHASYSFRTLTRQPSAFLPMVMSFAALTVVLLQVAVHGLARETDEGAAAHLWQLLIAAQLPVVVFFAIKWLRRAPRQTIEILAVQSGALLANFATVFFLGLG